MITGPARRQHAWIGVLPFVVLCVVWWIIPRVLDYTAYMLPAPEQVLARLGALLKSGLLLGHIAASLKQLAIGFVLGNVLAVLFGVAIATNRDASDLLRPVLTFLQSIAGIAWVPLAIIWFGIGKGVIVFVVANTIFFSSLNNAVAGIQQIPDVLYRAARSNGASSWQILRELLLPGALVQIIVGMRTSMAYGWRALVAAEMIAGTQGLGYMTLEAVQWYQTDTVILGMISIGLIWLILDRGLFQFLERRTVVRWGMLRK